MVEVDCTRSTVAVDAPRQLVPVYDNEGVIVLGMDVVTAGTATAAINVGLHDASATEIDEDQFINAVDGAAGSWNPAAWAPYVNRTGATVYLTLDADTAGDSAGKYRVHYKKFPVLEV
jgi:hypothetical protein